MNASSVGLKLEGGYAKKILKQESLVSAKNKKNKKLNDKLKEYFYLELYSMLEAGIDLKKSLDIFVNRQKDGNEKMLFESLRSMIISGKSLSESMQISGAFTPYEYYCIQIGEESGKLLIVLNELTGYYTNKLKIKKQIKKSLSYPVVILSASIIAVVFMLMFIVPMFSEVFKRFEGELPALTIFFVNLSVFFSKNIVLILFLINLAVAIVVYMLKQQFVMKKIQTFYPQIPFVGAIIASVYKARLCSSLTLLIGAKVPLINSIQLVCKMVNFYPIQKSLLCIETEIMKGNSFYDSLCKQKLFDEKALSLIKIGEEVNKLDIFFNKLSQRYNDEVDTKTNTLNTFLEPLIIVFLGFVIGLILISMYLPMFKLSTSMGM